MLCVSKALAWCFVLCLSLWYDLWCMTPMKQYFKMGKSIEERKQLLGFDGKRPLSVPMPNLNLMNTEVDTDTENENENVSDPGKRVHDRSGVRANGLWKKRLRDLLWVLCPVCSIQKKRHGRHFAELTWIPHHSTIRDEDGDPISLLDSLSRLARRKWTVFSGNEWAFVSVRHNYRTYNVYRSGQSRNQQRQRRSFPRGPTQTLPHSTRPTGEWESVTDHDRIEELERKVNDLQRQLQILQFPNSTTDKSTSTWCNLSTPPPLNVSHFEKRFERTGMQRCERGSRSMLCRSEIPSQASRKRPMLSSL